MYDVLVVDDEHLVIDGIRRIFERYCGAFRVAALTNDGGSALELIENRRFDLLITDIRMPVMDGLELIRLAKEKQPELLVILISGYEELEYYRKAIQRGVFAYILKPINIQEFVKTVGDAQEVLARRKPGEKEESSELPAGESAPSNSSKNIREAISYLEKNFSKHISLTDVAEQVYMHPVYFSQIFKQRVGVTFSEYLTNLRMERAKEYLSLLDYKIKDIPQMVGFYDEKHFYKVFKKYTGMTPMEYRNHT